MKRISRLRQRAEACVGYQSEDISRLRQELANANAEIQNNTMGRAQTVLHEGEIAHMNEVLSNELLMSKANPQHHEAEVSLMQNALRDRSAIFNSEVANLQSAIQNQRELQVQKSGFTEEEIKSFLVRKLAMYCAEFQQESMTLQSMIQSEGDIAKLYKGRFEDIAQSAVGTDSNSEIIMKALQSRLDYEADNTDFHRVKRDEAVQEMRDMRTELKVKEYEYEAEKGDKVLTRFGNGSKKKRKEGNITIGSGRNPNPNWVKRIKGLESDTDRLRDDQNEQKACSQQLYEELWENEEYGHREVNEEATAEASESSKLESSESKSRISRREADKIVAPPSPKPH